jgi:ketosteroid isomerase-like protein
MRTTIASLFICATLSGCAMQAKAPTPCGGGDPAGLRMRDIIAADNARDLQRVLAYYTADVVWAPPPPRPKMEGIAAIRSTYETLYATFEPALTISSESTWATGATARVTGRTGGRLHPMAGGEDTAVNDQFVAQLRCEGGGWRVASMEWWPAAEAPPVIR